MRLENAGELVTVGQQIVKLGAELDAARAELNAAQAKVTTIENELRPLLIRHSELIQSAVGAGGITLSAPPTAPAAPHSHVPPVPGPPASSELSLAAPGSAAALPASQQLKARVKDFLKSKNMDGISATDVAEALHIDALVVREAMLEMRYGR